MIEDYDSYCFAQLCLLSCCRKNVKKSLKIPHYDTKSLMIIIEKPLLWSGIKNFWHFKISVEIAFFLWLNDEHFCSRNVWEPLLLSIHLWKLCILWMPAVSSQQLIILQVTKGHFIQCYLLCCLFLKNGLSTTNWQLWGLTSSHINETGLIESMSLSFPVTLN